MCRKVLTPVTTPSNTLSTPTDTIFEFDITKYQISFDEKINQLTSKLDSKITSIRKEFNETAKSIKSVCVELNTDLGKIVAAHNVAIKSLQNSMAENKNAIDILNANIENNNNICIQQSVKEIEDRLARKRNFIILNIPESKSPSELVKKSDDIKEFTNLIKSTDSAELVEIAEPLEFQEETGNIEYFTNNLLLQRQNKASTRRLQKSKRRLNESYEKWREESGSKRALDQFRLNVK
ncbi:uncharacterized protein LOC122859596 isoform X2 [Aphidius gifuensis]|uniref:uncharacterized protein LOC122859596 isoform X2 n=1 Tax=Aphidius gifuensis TaxID=684658 RepID=UPI001CDC1A85|nr:uncharacterized protein LOC122859596 isoform X2 [Aphidius gifuensis]